MLLCSPLLFLALTLTADPAVEADYVIRGATLYDGTGQPGKEGDLAIKGDRIVAIGSFQTAGKPKVLEGKGLVVAPGFIDLHTHSDTPLTQARTKANLCYLMQGVTLVVTGNCGSGPVDVADYFKKLETGGIGSNVIHQVPHNDVRSKVMGNANRQPTAEELKKMEALVDKAMRDGAWGLSTGLIYTPGSYSKTEELIALARIASKHQGFYASHIRDEGTGLLIAVEEILRIGREAKLPVHISHMKASGQRAWGKSADAIAMVEKAKASGQIVTADQYPYTASSTSLAATLIPPQYREGTRQEYLDRLGDFEFGPKIRKAIQERLTQADEGKRIRIARYSRNSLWSGLDLAAIAELEKKTPLEVVLEIERHGGAQVVNFGMNEEDVRLIMKQSFVATASDGGSQVPSDTKPHPRSYGTFPRKIGHYAIEQKVLPLSQAIRSASGLPADVLRLTNRGYLRPKYFADVVVFDPETFRDKATYDDPHQYATGVKYLFVNGKLVIAEGKYNGALAGKPLRHESGPSLAD